MHFYMSHLKDPPLVGEELMPVVSGYERDTTNKFNSQTT